MAHGERPVDRRDAVLSSPGAAKHTSCIIHCSTHERIEYDDARRS